MENLKKKVFKFLKFSRAPRKGVGHARIFLMSFILHMIHAKKFAGRDSHNSIPQNCFCKKVPKTYAKFVTYWGVQKVARAIQRTARHNHYMQQKYTDRVPCLVNIIAQLKKQKKLLKSADLCHIPLPTFIFSFHVWYILYKK